MKTPRFFLKTALIAVTLSVLSRVQAAKESFPVLSANDLEPKLVSGTKTLEAALATQKKNPGARIETRGEYFSWLSQCVDYIGEDSKSKLWGPCLHFASQLLRIEVSGETVSQIVEPYKKHRSKWDETVKKFPEADRLFLNQEAENAIGSADEDS